MQKIAGHDLFAHQEIPIEYWRSHPEQGRIYLAMEPGTGKSRVLTTIAKESPADYVLFWSPKALHGIYPAELEAVGEDPQRKNRFGIKRYHYFSVNAGNIYEQWQSFLEKIGVSIMQLLPSKSSKSSTTNQRKMAHEERFDGLFDPESSSSTSSNTKISETPTLLIIIDECHLLSQRIAHTLNQIYFIKRRETRELLKDKGIYKLYLELRDLLNTQFIMSSGTVIPNLAFDTVPILNILRGRIYDINGRFGYAFPDLFSDFYYTFIKPPPETKYHELFASRIQNLVYWYRIPRGASWGANKILPIPDVAPDIILRLKMKMTQWKLYSELAAKEESLEVSMKRKKDDIQEGVPLVGTASVYRSFTRQACNITYPKEFWDMKERVANITDDMIKHIGDYSIKIEKFMELLLKKHPNQIHGLHSHFVHDYGIAVIQRVLEQKGWKNMSKDDHTVLSSVDKLVEVQRKDKSPRYAILTGDNTTEEKMRIINIFNSQLNAQKRMVRLVMISGAAGYGLTFYSVEIFHKFESDWNTSDEEQAQDRFVRLFSSQYLSSGRQVLTTYRYVAEAPGEHTVYKTSDQIVYEVARRKEQENIPIEDMFASASIACRGMFQAENSYHASVIKSSTSKARTIPPMRMHVSCRVCDSELVPSLILQAGLPLKCVATTPTKPKAGKSPVVKYEDKKYVLSKDTGHAFEVLTGELVIDRKLIRYLWSLL